MPRDSERELIDRLGRERPIPRPSYRGSLRRRLVAMEGSGAGQPRQLRALIAIYATSGTALLAVAAIGLLGAGPFAAG